MQQGSKNHIPLAFSFAYGKIEGSLEYIIILILYYIMEKLNEKINSKQEQEAKKYADFTMFFPEGTIESVQELNIPKEAMTIFERKSEQFIKKQDYRPRNFDHYFLISHANGDKTYCAQQTKTYNPDNTEELSYFADMRDDKFLGYSELRKNISNKKAYFKDKPFVGYTSTEKQFQKQGLGTRRLQFMNAYSEMQYSRPLYSDTLNQEKNIWENLTKKGLAKKFTEGEGGNKQVRYVFISTGK